MSIEILKETGALLEGHFLLSSGRHSDRRPDSLGTYRADRNSG